MVAKCSRGTINKPVSSRHSRTAQERGVSSASHFPPGNSERPARGTPAGRIPTRIRPADSTTAIPIRFRRFDISLTMFAFAPPTELNDPALRRFRMGGRRNRKLTSAGCCSRFKEIGGRCSHNIEATIDVDDFASHTTGQLAQHHHPHAANFIYIQIATQW